MISLKGVFVTFLNMTVHVKNHANKQVFQVGLLYGDIKDITGG